MGFTTCWSLGVSCLGSLGLKEFGFLRNAGFREAFTAQGLGSLGFTEFKVYGVSCLGSLRLKFTELRVWELQGLWVYSFGFRRSFGFSEFGAYVLRTFGLREFRTGFRVLWGSKIERFVLPPLWRRKGETRSRGGWGQTLVKTWIRHGFWNSALIQHQP